MLNAVLPLGFLTPGRDAVVRDVVGGKELRQRLCEMGFARGSLVRIVQSQPCGPLIISLGDGRIVLGRGVAQKIMVEEVDN
ncbi:MAG: FeoA domain-containing protein [Clostridia bacterium]|nr:FeoA domain-containing protein [Clostridia bacterium]MDQ7792446.1 FeoA domain-containing protein [Clostridia bacterium]